MACGLAQWFVIRHLALTGEAVKMLHILNGDATRLGLERSGVPGELTVWADVLHDGPVPAGLDQKALRELRVRYIAAAYHLDEPGVLRIATRWDAGLERFRDHQEVVFWFEHDLFDQLILVRHLHWLSTIQPVDTRFSLICIGSFPGVEHFTGLGPLSPEQLATLLPQRQPITHEQIESGQRAWELFRAPDPLPLLKWMGDATPVLPFLPGALVRHFEDYPWTSDGLSRTERQMLAAITEGHDTVSTMFVACQRREERVFMGDLTFTSILRRLARAGVPLVEFVDDARVRLTAVGRDVLSGRADHVLLNGIDRWMGGVHLRRQSYWRWDGLALTRG